MSFHINSEKEYYLTLITVFDLMSKGEENLSEYQLNEVLKMAEIAEKFEDQVLFLKPTK